MSFDLLPHFFFSLNDGGRLRYAQFAPSPNPRGTVLVVPGAREFIEKKYIELGRRLVARGYRVVIYEPRGQGLSSRFLSGDMRQRDHIEDFSIHLDDLRSFYEAVVLPGLTEPLFVHGHSLGAHILLRWLAEDKPKAAGAFFTAPMIALSGMMAHMMGYGISWASVRMFSSIGAETLYAPMQHDFGGDDHVFANNPLTHDAAHFRIMGDYFVAHPDLMTGGVTWGWLLAALRSMNTTHGRPYLEGIDIPVLALVGDQDLVTPPAEIAPFLDMIPHVTAHTIVGARHDILNETDALCAEAWRHIDAFLISGKTALRAQPTGRPLREERLKDSREPMSRILPTG